MIKIKKSETADTRTAKEIVTKDKLLASSRSHISDVKQAMKFLIDKMELSASNHDFTKIDNIDEFFNDFYDTQTKQLDFTRDGSWWQNHVKTERHHLNSYCPDDVNLIDVLEMICDCTVAGMARSGKFREFTLSDEILQKALKNTIKLVLDNIQR